MKKNSLILRWIFMIILICSVSASLAQPKESEGRGFFMLGWRSVDMDKLNASMQSQEYAELSNSFLSIGGCGYSIMKNWILGGEGHAIEGDEVTTRGYKVSVAGGYGLLNVGYLIHKKNNLNIYPMLGVGGGAVTLNIVENSTPSFDEMLQDPKRGTQISSAGFMFSVGIGADYLIMKKKNDHEEGGLALGFRAGYSMAPFVGDWIFRDEAISGGPELGITGPYVMFMIGGGGKTRE